MGYFDLPRGEVTIKVKDGKKTVVKSIAFCDSLYKEEIAEMWERWSESYKILEMQFNGRKVEPMKNYHWELRYKDELFGTFKLRKDAYAALMERKHKKWDDKSIRVGTIYFVQD